MAKGGIGAHSTHSGVTGAAGQAPTNFDQEFQERYEKLFSEEYKLRYAEQMKRLKDMKKQTGK